MADEYFIPIYCILPKKCVVKEIFISEWRIGDVHGLTNNRRKHNIKSPNGCIARAEAFLDSNACMKIRIKSMLQYQIYGKFAGRKSGELLSNSSDKILYCALFLTDYLHTYRLTPEELAGKIMREIYEQTGITATAGIGTNLYLAKIAMDIMSREDRAAQFAPFAALTGHKDAIRETERLTERKRRLSEDCRQILDLYLREVCQSQEPREVDFEYFVPDQKKEGGSYQKKSGCIRRIDTYLNEIVLQSGDRIPLDEIVDIDGVIAAADEV